MLVIDIGNTSVVMAIYKGKRLTRKKRIFPLQNENYYLKEIRNFLRQKEEFFKHISLIIISSVVPRLNPIFKRVIKKIFRFSPIILTRKDIDIKILTLHPDKVGIDRLVNAYAVYRLYNCPAIIIDFGTATTFDLVTEKGEYAGGIIAPGIDISRKALFEKAEQLFPASFVKTKGIIGKTTKDAMQIGIYYSVIGQVDKIVNRIQKRIGKCRIIATGGYCNLIKSKFINKTDKDLILKGLVLVGKKIREKKKIRKN